LGRTTSPQIFPQSFLTLRELSFAADFILKNRWDPESFTNSKNYLSALTSTKTEALQTDKSETRSKIDARDGPYGLDGGQFLAGS